MLSLKEKNTFINKGIVYSDFILNFNNSQEKLKVTNVSNINEENINDCIDTIINSNNGILFHTIQYSKENNTLYFYTNREISTGNWCTRKTYKPINNNKEILLELKKVLNNKVYNEELISLYDILKCINNMNNKIYRYKEIYINQIKERLRNNGYRNSQVVFQIFNKKNDELKMSFLYDSSLQHSINAWKEIVFSKDNGDIFIKSSNSEFSENIFYLVSELVSKLYDLYSLNNYHSCKNSIKSSNSNFLVNISLKGVCIKYISDDYCDFEIHSSSYNDKYDYKCNSSNLLNVIKGRENELFKNIFVSISDCPMWIYDELKEFQIKEKNKKHIISNIKKKVLSLIKR